MKINMPVTDREIPLGKGQILVSRTDLNGMITYANDDFVAVSGFSRHELTGANHNIIRHPDMPPTVFADLWASLKALRPWYGIVKNRTQAGDYYWVDVSVLPVFKNGEVHEYLSVRRAPSRDNIERAERLYQQLNANKAALKPTGFAALCKALREIGPGKKIALAQAVQLAPIGYWMYQLYWTQDYPLLAGVVASVAAASLIGANALSSMATTLNQTIGIFYRLAEKRFGNVKDLTRNDLIGDFQRGLYSMEVQLQLELAQAKEEAVRSQRFNQALDSVHVGVMVADNNYDIIYMNDSVQALFKSAESDIRRQLPHFDADKLLGANMDSFHKNPDRQRRMLENLTEPYHSQLNIAGHTITVIASPVTDDQGRRIGVIAEWRDRTHEVLIEQEIAQLVQDVKAGKLDARIDLADKQGCHRQLSAGINELTDVIESVLNDINSVMAAMSHGDLAVAITNDYQGVYAECKDNINGALAKMSDFIIHIRDAADFIDNSSKEIASGNNDLSHRAEQQAASLEQTAASMEQLASAVRNNAAGTQQANQGIRSATAQAQKGAEIVHSAVIAMQDINDSSNQIAEIINVIDDIAFLTNLLALNASVEAARAGDHGIGFSVVAKEVRNLAQRCATAAQQSRELIQDSVCKIRAGAAFVNETGNALSEIVNSVTQVGDIVAQIASASSEQTAGIDQINQAVSQLDDITQQNAALAEQAAAGGIAMRDQTAQMGKLLSFFSVNAPRGQRAVKTVAVGKAPASAPPKRIAPAIARKPKIEVSDEWDEF